MKTSTQILLLLALLSLLSLTFSVEVHVTESFSTSESFHSSSNGDGNGGGIGSGGEEEEEASGSANEEGEASGEEAEIENPPTFPGGFTACDPDNRPEICTREYAPVCGYIHECEGGACTSTFSTGCTACSNSNVDGWVDGACEDVRTACDPDNRPDACPFIYTPTCAVAADCQGSHCFEDASNSCLACSMEGVAYSLPGACPSNDETDEREFCDASNRPEVCTADYTPVCAHQSNCVGENCWSTAGNACAACGDENIDFYVPGECSEDEERTFCDDSNRPEACTFDYTPVCAHITDCTGEDCWFTAGNACTACGNATVDYHVPGECATDEGEDEGDDDDRTFCDADNRPEICTLDYTPVCAHIINCAGDSCWFTAGNACGACGNSTVDWHIPGECGPGDERTYCDPNARPEVCTADYNPVCAHTSGCTGDDCWNTAGNACGACGDATVDYWYPGECPGDEDDGGDDGDSR